MKLLKIGMVSILVVGLLAACGKDEINNKGISKVMVDEDNGKEEVAAHELPEFLPQTKEWVAETLAEFNRPPEERFHEAGNDVGLVYYIKAQEAIESMYQKIHPEEVGYDEDFSNVRLLAAAISHNQFVRTAHINNNTDKTNLDYVKDWKPVPEDMELSFEYMKRLLNDLDVAINKNGEGETFGVSNLMDGDKVRELENIFSH
ncbi:MULTISPECIES: hypothetical protein [unclassified Sporosarcina]|uniref:hypothetical protein n=1 Tax=unclassified Sporosarcina TaxID=2647733 RepID=UPI001A918BF0|nr:MULTISPECIES: hypothetical protein [unclassified Sporosarcina]MBO0587609.1 hypothetical protein [Sporosarcina sp. E16_8]MBO0602401.1 hypothetical protein [Sporosarcina sp. E16_3]